MTMNLCNVLCAVLIGIPFLVPPAWEPGTATSNPSQQTSEIGTTEPAANPQIERLAKALAGDWNTTETMERGEFFPNGGSRHGVVHAHLAAGGTTLIYEVNSDGDAGKLDGFIAIWWDKAAKLYHFFACFNNPEHPCSARGDAHWEGDRLVNNYFEVVKGKKTRWQDSFSFTSSTHTLVAAEDVGRGKMKSVITTRATRR
jgi:hypothetical protein